MKYIAAAVLCLAVYCANGQSDKTLAANEMSELRLIIGIVIAVVVMIAIYILLRKEDK